MATETTPWLRRILVIDDEDAIHCDFRRVLTPDLEPDDELLDLEKAVRGSASEQRESRSPFELDSATSGREGVERVAIALAKGNPFALAFVDLRLSSDWDGLETTRQMRRNPKTADLPVVALTALTQASDERRARAAGCDGYITKPIRLSRFPGEIRAFLREEIVNC